MTNRAEDKNSLKLVSGRAGFGAFRAGPEIDHVEPDPEDLAVSGEPTGIEGVAEDQSEDHDIAGEGEILVDEDSRELHVFCPKAVARGPNSEEHQRTHIPFLPTCWICVMANAQRKPCRRFKGDPIRLARTFGDIVTVDIVTACISDQVEGPQ